MQSLEFHYTAHYNWAWVVDAALLSLKQKTEGVNSLNLTSYPRFKDLPSTIASVKKEKATYSLFRIDVTPSESSTPESLDLICKVRTRSDIFGFLDPKDSLARVCQLLDSKECMPDTVLIPWDWQSTATEQHDVEKEGVLVQSIVDMLRTGPKLLKAPLGSGGFGLYFVYSLYDIQEIVRCHRIKAQEKEGFMEDLQATFYGFKSSSVLAWSLQDVISGVRVVPPGTGSVGGSGGSDSGGVSSSVVDTNSTGYSATSATHITNNPNSRRCQVRAYIVMVNDQVYLYKVYEVRLPSWDLDLDALLQDEHNMYHNYNDSAASTSTTTTTTDTDTSNVNTANTTSTSTTTHTPTWSNALENEYCGSGHGRPYNECRNKGSTERYVLCELTELASSDSRIEECMVKMFTALKPVVVSRQRQGSSNSSTGSSGSGSASGTSSGVNKDIGHVFDWDEIVRTQHTTSVVNQSSKCSEGSVMSEVAIVGVDLVLQQHTVTDNTTTFSARIVEINNNPAMPAAEGKHMSALYKQHLVDFVASTMQLAVYGNNARLRSEEMDAQLAELKFRNI